MCEWLAFLMLLFGCDVCSFNGRAVLYLGSISGNTCPIEMVNVVPVKGVQFTLNGAQPVEVYTTSRTEGFFVAYNKEEGMVIMVSLSGAKIKPGVGTIVFITCDGSWGRIYLSNIRIVE